MAKKSTLSQPAEVVVAGQPSKVLVAELKACGERVTTEHLTNAIAHLEAARVGFVTEAIATGILLLAKRETLSHGEWQPFCAEVWGKVNRKHASDLPPAALDNFVRSLRVYCFLAQHFLADLEQKSFQPEARDCRVDAPPVAPAEVLALDSLPQEKRILVYNAIGRFVAGRSLRRLLIDFRRAESAADQEEIDEANRRKKRKDKTDPAQLDFWAEMQAPITAIESLFDDKSFVEKTDKEFWIRTAEALETQAKRAREMAKGVK
jgi:hypothetical protein